MYDAGAATFEKRVPELLQEDAFDVRKIGTTVKTLHGYCSLMKKTSMRALQIDWFQKISVSMNDNHGKPLSIIFEKNSVHILTNQIEM